MDMKEILHKLWKPDNMSDVFAQWSIAFILGTLLKYIYKSGYLSILVAFIICFILGYYTRKLFNYVKSNTRE